MRSMVIGAGMAALWATALCSSDAAAQDFYKGRTLTIVVAFTPGGGYDANARLLARHIGRHIPGNPTVIVQNMPGAGGLTAVNYLGTAAPTDGTFIEIFTFGDISDSRVQPDKVNVDFRNFNWLGSIGEDPTYCYVASSLGDTSLAGLRAHGQLHMGLTSFGTSTDINEKILQKILGVDLKEISGYPGSAEMRLAFEKGELDGSCGAWGETPADWIASRKIAPIVSFGSFRPPGMAESVPFAGDVAKSERNRSIIRLLTASAEIGRPFIAPRAVPAERMKILRDAFDATMKDPAFLADASKMNLPIAPKNAADAQEIVEDIYTIPDDIVEAARKVMGE